MQVITSSAELKQVLPTARHSLAFVPTMGALHDGHLSLVTLATQHASSTLVSIFVNPRQFAPHEDLAVYPRPRAEDLEKLKKLGIDFVFTPSSQEIYPPTFQTAVTNDTLADELCGKTRPQHFRGALTVMLKLLLLINPQVLVLGRKDYQQLIIITRLIADLQLPITVLAGKTQRAADGLALSSRLVYLNAAQRRAASAIYPALCAARQAYAAGERRVAELVRVCAAELHKTKALQVEYLELRARDDLAPITATSVPPTSVLLVAVRIGHTRLIDNIELGCSGKEPGFMSGANV